MDAQGSNVNVKTFYFFDGLKDGRNKMDPSLDNSVFDGINIYAVDGCLRTNDALFDPINTPIQLLNKGATMVSNAIYGASPGAGNNFPYIYTQRTGLHKIITQVQIPFMWNEGASGTTLLGGIYDGVSNYLFQQAYALAGSGYSTFVFTLPGTGLFSLNRNDRLSFGLTNHPDMAVYPLWGDNGIINFYFDSATNHGVKAWAGVLFSSSLSGAANNGYNARSLYFAASGHHSFISSLSVFEGSGSTSLNKVILNNLGNLSWFSPEGAGGYLIQDFAGKLKTSTGVYLNMANVNMNERNAVIVYGGGIAPTWVCASSDGFFATSMTTYFKNGTTSDASGYQLATVWPLLINEFKNRLYLDNVSILYSDSSGPHLEPYPHSSFLSDGFMPDIYDWDNEILFDTVRPITAAIEYRDNLFRFTDSEVFYVGVDSSGEPTPPKRITGAPGTQNIEAVITLGGLLYWANDGGVYVTDGNTYTCISNDVSKFFSNNAISDGTLSRAFWLSACERTGELFVEYVFWSGYPIVVCGAGTLVYNIRTKTWGIWEVPVIGNVQTTTGVDCFITALGGTLIRKRPGVKTYKYGYSQMDYDLYKSYNATGHARVEKACLLSPDYSKQADMVYARVMMKGCSCASQAFKITTFWDGQPSSPNAQSLTFNVTPTQTGYDDVVTTNKFLLPGKGNLAYFKLERDPVNHGDYPLEFIGIQIQYSLVDRSDE